MPKGPTYLRSLIPRLVREYATPEAAITALSRQIPGVNRIDVERLWGEFTAQQALAPIESGRDLRMKPTQGELLTQSVVKGKAYMQEVLIIGRTRAGVLISRRVEVPSEQLKPRWQAIKRAEEVAQGMISAEGPKDTDLVEVFAGIHVGAYRRNYI